MLNGDVLTDLDLTAQIAQHEEGRARTLALIPVEDPTAYGLVRRNSDGAVTEFLEKPQPRPDRHQPDQRRRLRDGPRLLA